jgi:hypothetical protein
LWSFIWNSSEPKAQVYSLLAKRQMLGMGAPRVVSTDIFERNEFRFDPAYFPQSGPCFVEIAIQTERASEP